MHYGEWNGLDQYAHARTNPFLEAEQEKAPEKELPGQHVEQLNPLVHEEIVHAFCCIPVQWIGVFQVGELECDEQYRDHDEIEKKYFFRP